MQIWLRAVHSHLGIPMIPPTLAELFERLPTGDALMSTTGQRFLASSDRWY